jgi:hypothetical protein
MFSFNTKFVVMYSTYLETKFPFRASSELLVAQSNSKTKYGLRFHASVFFLSCNLQRALPLHFV